MMLTVAVLLPAAMFLCCCSATAGDKSAVVVNATSIAGHPVLLNCHMALARVEHRAVVWLRPSDGLPLPVRGSGHGSAPAAGTRSVSEAAESTSRFVLVGNSTAGEHHLLIRYTVFPDDAGRWTCVSLSDSHLVRRTQLTLLVAPPTRSPEVIPSSVNKSEVHRSASEVYTVSCVSHFAYPPVDLAWVKEYGPDAKYTVSPPQMLVSRSGTVSARRTLVLSSSNAASLFTCVASHPTFAGDVGQQTLRFMLSTDDTPPAHAQAQQSDADVTHVQSSVSVSKPKDSVDRATLLTGVVLVFVCGVVVVMVMSKCSPFDCQFTAKGAEMRSANELSDSVDGEATSMMHDQTTHDAAADTNTTTADGAAVRRCPRRRRQGQCKSVGFTAMSLLLVSSLVLCFPLYMTGVTTPTTESDEVQAVFAGSALWLDCTSLVQPLDSLVQVSWFRDTELLYYQYLVNRHPVSYPAANTTSALMFHARVTSKSVGQITVWPVAPAEGGVYSCHVVMTGDVRRAKTVAVFVLTGAVVNYALLSCLSLSLLSAVTLISLVVHHLSVTRRRPDTATATVNSFARRRKNEK